MEAAGMYCIANEYLLSFDFIFISFITYLCIPFYMG